MRIGIKRSVAKAICKRWGLPLVMKANPHHDERGRFAGGKGAIGGDSEQGARDEQIAAFVEAALQEGGKTHTLVVGKITDAAKARIKAKTGIEGVEQLVIDTSSVRHSLGKTRDNLTKEDFLKIADVVNTSDDIELSDKKNRNNITAVFLEKTNDKTTALQLVMEFRKNNENLALVTFYRQRKKRAAAPMPTEVSPKLTSKTAATLKRSIPQGTRNASETSRFMLRKSVARRVLRAPLPRLAFGKSGRVVVRW